MSLVPSVLTPPSLGLPVRPVQSVPREPIPLRRDRLVRWAPRGPLVQPGLQVLTPQCPVPLVRQELPVQLGLQVRLGLPRLFLGPRDLREILAWQAQPVPRVIQAPQERRGLLVRQALLEPRAIPEPQEHAGIKGDRQDQAQWSQPQQGRYPPGHP